MAVGDTYVFSGFPTPVLTQLSFQSHRFFSHATAEMRGENTLARKSASARDRTHNHQVMSPTRSPMSNLQSRAKKPRKEGLQNIVGDGKKYR